MSTTPEVKQISQVPVQTAADIDSTHDYLLSLDADDELKIKRILHSEVKAKILENYVIGGSGLNALLTNSAEQTMTNKTLDGCVLKDCLFQETPPGGGDPGDETTVSELIAEKVSEEVAEKVAEEVAGIEREVSRNSGIVYEAAYGTEDGLTASDILLNAALSSEEYCIPLRNISMMAIMDIDNKTLTHITDDISTVNQIINPGTPIEVICLHTIGTNQSGLTGILIIRYIPELIFVES